MPGIYTNIRSDCGTECLEQADAAEVQARAATWRQLQAALKVMGIVDPDDLVKAPRFV